MARKTNAESPEANQVVRVHNAWREGYRRGGKAHKLGTADHPAGSFTAEQLAALQADPKLSVQVVDKPAEPPADAAKS